MYHLFEANRIIEFKKWLGTSLPSANDNNDPDHDCGVSAADPRGKTGAGAISCDLQPGQTRLVKRG